MVRKSFSAIFYGAALMSCLIALPRSASAALAEFPGNAADQHIKGSGESIAFDVSNAIVNGGDVLVLAWSNDETRMVHSFARKIDSAPWRIEAKQLDKLPTGRVQLQLLSRTANRAVDLDRHWINVYDKPTVEVDDGAPEEYVKGSEKTVGFHVDGDTPPSTDVLTIAWSDAESRMVDAYAHTMPRDAGEIAVEKLDTLPAGRVELQLYARVNEAWVDQAKHRMTVFEERAVAFADDAPSALQTEPETAISFEVSGPMPDSSDVLVLAWHEDQRQMIDDFAHTQSEAPWQISAEQLGKLPAGQVELQLHLRDGVGSRAEVIDFASQRVTVESGGTQPPEEEPGLAIERVDGVSSGAELEGEVDIRVETSTVPHHVDFVLFHEDQQYQSHQESLDPYCYLGDDALWNTAESPAGEYTLYVEAYASDTQEPTDQQIIRFSVRDQSSTDPGDGSGDAPAQGWAELGPEQAEQVVYVSASGGDDGNPGTRDQPVRTIGRGKQLLRDGRGDWMLLKRGDVFGRIGNWTKSGRSADQPMVVGAYGDGPRPELRADGDHMIFVGDGSPAHVMFASLRARAARRDPSSSQFDGGGDKANGVFWLGGGSHIRFDDCLFEYFNNGMVLLSPSADNPIQDVTLHRTHIRHSYAASYDQGHSQGMYTNQLEGLTLRGCTFYHNGWAEHVSDGRRTMFNHNLYLTGTKGLMVEDCLVGEGSLRGMTLRTGGDSSAWQRDVTVRDNFLYGNGAAMPSSPKKDVEHVSKRLRIENNVMFDHSAYVEMGGDLIQIANGIKVAAWHNAAVRKNILVQGPAPDNSTNNALEVDTWRLPSLEDVRFTENIVHDWGKNRTSLGADGVKAWDNHIGLDPSRYHDASRTLSDYVQTHTDLNSAGDFFNAAAMQSKGDWDGDLTAESVNAYFREGFTVK